MAPFEQGFEIGRNFGHGRRSDEISPIFFNQQFSSAMPEDESATVFVRLNRYKLSLARIEGIARASVNRIAHAHMSRFSS
jgi:hypothetical protein